MASGSTRGAGRRTRSTTGPPCCSSVASERDDRRARTRRARVPAAGRTTRRGLGVTLRRRFSARCRRRPGGLCARCVRSGRGALARATRAASATRARWLRRRSRPSGRAPGSQATAAHCDAAARAAAERRLRACTGRDGPRRRLAVSRAAARSRSRTRSAKHVRGLGGDDRHRLARRRAAADGRLVLADVVPRELVRLACAACPSPTSGASARYRHGPEPSSSTGRSTGRSRGGPTSADAPAPSTSAATLDEISALGVGRAWSGRTAERPFVLLVATDDLRPDARARGQARRLGVLPRP